MEVYLDKSKWANLKKGLDLYKALAEYSIGRQDMDPVLNGINQVLINILTEMRTEEEYE